MSKPRPYLLHVTWPSGKRETFTFTTTRARSRAADQAHQAGATVEEAEQLQLEEAS